MKSRYATITTKGQVTIPVNIRNRMQLKTGSKLEFIMKGDSLMVVPVNKSVKRLKGILPKPEKPLTLEEMENIIKAAKGHDDRN
jgi:antitoxin PrlF